MTRRALHPYPPVAQCVTPLVRFVGEVRISVTLNGQQYGAAAPAFVYEDHWHSPPQSGVLPSRTTDCFSKDLIS